MPNIKPGTLFLKTTTVKEIESKWNIVLPNKYKLNQFGIPKLYVKTSKQGNIHWDKPMTKIYTSEELNKLNTNIKILKT